MPKGPKQARDQCTKLAENALEEKEKIQKKYDICQEDLNRASEGYGNLGSFTQNLIEAHQIQTEECERDFESCEESFSSLGTENFNLRETYSTLQKTTQGVQSYNAELERENVDCSAENEKLSTELKEFKLLVEALKKKANQKYKPFFKKCDPNPSLTSFTWKNLVGEPPLFDQIVRVLLLGFRIQDPKSGFWIDNWVPAYLPFGSVYQ